MVTNTVKAKPQFNTHRLLTGAPVVAEAVPAASREREALNCSGWKLVAGYVKLSGGAAPTATLTFYEAVTKPDGTIELRAAGLATAALADGEGFELEANGGRYLAILSAVAGAPTQVEVLMAGAQKAEPGTF